MAVPFTCSQYGYQVALSPTNLYQLDLVTGSSTLIGAISPSGTYNAIGYNVLDNYIYGYSISTNRIIRLSSDATADTLPLVSNLPIGYYAGDVNLNGYFYLYTPNQTRFYVVDVNSSRSTYLQLVDPANNFQQQTSNFGVPITPNVMYSWAINPVDSQLYGVASSSGNVIRVNPITGASTVLTTSGIPSGFNYGAAFFDLQGNFYVLNNTTGGIYRTVITATTASAMSFGSTISHPNNDGTRCPLAPLDLMSVVKSVNLTEAKLGNRLTYTIVVTNNSTIVSTTNVILTDSIPNGTTYVDGSAIVDGSPAVGTPSTGITIGALTTGASATVQFQVDISSTQLPYPNPIPDIATVSYNEGLPIDSNTVYTRVIFPERGISFI